MLYDYAYLLGSLVLLAWWGILFWLKPGSRKKMLLISLLTVPLGLIEFIFIPTYWDPPTLFSLGSKYHLDIEALIFSFAIGGVAAAIYGSFRRVKAMRVNSHERQHIRHRFHNLALVAPIPIFLLTYALLPVNPIYPTIISLLAGAVATSFCRPDLAKMMAISGLIFVLHYFIIFYFTLVLPFPGFVARVWNLPDLSGILVGGVPLEELLFAATFGAVWSSIYEHSGWYKLKEK